MYKFIFHLSAAIQIISGLRDHAQNELELAGLFDEDSDYNGMIGNAVMELINVFADQGHSGFSAELTLAIFDMVARFRPLTPITNNHIEWIDISKYSNAPLWQNKRSPNLFSEDGGKTWYDVNDK